MKALLLRVGIDKGYGGLSPVFANFTFRYLPIYYKNKTVTERNESRTYCSLKLDTFLPSKLKDKRVHLDPEFESFTYGDPGIIKRASLLKLKEGDLLVFYIGGKSLESGEEGCYIIGYFVVESVVEWDAISTSQQKSVQVTFAKNAHIISSKSMNNLVLVKGSKRSKLLTKCISITEPNKKKSNPPYLTLPTIQKFLGIRSFIVRAVPIWIDKSEHIRNLQVLLGIKCLK